MLHISIQYCKFYSRNLEHTNISCVCCCVFVWVFFFVTVDVIMNRNSDFSVHTNSISAWFTCKWISVWFNSINTRSNSIIPYNFCWQIGSFLIQVDHALIQLVRALIQLDRALFQVPYHKLPWEAIFHLRQPMAFLSHSSYGMPGLALMNVLF